MSAAVYLDGKALPAREGATVQELLALAGRDPAATVVTVDGRFVPRGDYRKYSPPDGARLAVYELHDGG